MSKLLIKGGKTLNGSVRVQGAKNSVLPILAATVLCDDISTIHGCPQLRDVSAAVKILECLGCRVKREGDTLTVDAKCVSAADLPDSLMRRMRSSITFLGAITARCGRAKMCSPGGCEIGIRPIDLHIKALRELGIRVYETGGYTETEADRIKGADIHLDFPSVGATENIMLASCLGDGKTTIWNAAKEPEISDLQDLLCKMGAKIKGAGSDVIVIDGVKKLHGAEHRVIPDRIVAATYLCTGAMCGGEINLTNICSTHIKSVISVLKDTGMIIKEEKDGITLKSNGRILPIDILRTMPYPGFPTDAQAPFAALLSLAEGTSVIVENIFENRFKYCGELCRMGADIKVSGRAAVIRGVKRFYGACVTAMDLRGGAALVAAGAAAHGETQIDGVNLIERGYESIEDDLAKLGADIKKD